MKTRFTILRIVSTIPILLLGFLPIMPNPFPWQYDIDGTVIRLGSPFELLIYILIPLVMGWYCYFWANNKKDEPIRNAKFIVTVLTIGLLILEVFYVWILVRGIQNSNSDTSAILRSLLYFVGALLILYGNEIPRSSYKSAFGIKNSWSESSEKAWIYSQRWSGALCIICGVSIVILSFFTTPTFVTILFPLLVLVLGSFVLSYIAFIKTNRK